MANQTTVEPGGQTFSTIQAAIDSIDDAGPQKGYKVIVNAGTYHESITLKEYVWVVGNEEAKDNTILTSNCTETGPPTVTGSSNSGIVALTVIANGAEDSASVQAVLAKAVTNFEVTGCKVYGKNTATNGVSTVTISIVGPGDARISNSTIDNQVSNQTGSAQAISGWAGVNLSIYNSDVTGLGAQGDGAAVLSDGAGTQVTVEISKVSCPDWALWIQDGGAMKSDDTTVVQGKVSPGVKQQPG